MDISRLARENELMKDYIQVNAVRIENVTVENFYGISEIGFGIYNKSLLTFKRTRSLYSVLYILKSFDD
jgi:hypothetical protein